MHTFSSFYSLFSNPHRQAAFLPMKPWTCDHREISKTKSLSPQNWTFETFCGQLRKYEKYCSILHIIIFLFINWKSTQVPCILRNRAVNNKSSSGKLESPLRLLATQRTAQKAKNRYKWSLLRHLKQNSWNTIHIFADFPITFGGVYFVKKL